VGESTVKRHYGRVESFPPYVGGDDDDIDEWEAQCDCGWVAERKWDYVTSAYIDIIDHLNSVINIQLCGCSVICGDDGDIDGPGVCKGLRRL
jgi:hypothetical protein